jgi:hypothetical protein
MNTTEPAGLAMEAHTYTAWDCLNDFFGVDEINVGHPQIVDDWYVSIRLKGRYDMERVSQAYALLPGVSRATPTVAMGDGPTTCAARSGGDCPAGCTETTAYYFVSSSPGSVEHIDTWDGAPYDSEAPDWYTLCDGS